MSRRGVQQHSGALEVAYVELPVNSLRDSGVVRHRGWLIQHPSFPQRPRQDMVEGVAPVGDVVMGVDEEIGRNLNSRQGMVEPDQLLVAGPFRPERLGFHHYQIDVRTLLLFAAPTGAEQDDLLWIDLVDDGLDLAIQKCIGHRLPGGNRRHHSTSSSSFSSPTVISRSIASTSRISSAGSSSGTASATRGLYRDAVRL